MEQILDVHLNEEKQEVVYAKFWRRAGAVLIDALILGVLTAPFTIYNMLSWKSLPLFLGSSLIALIYKPFLEYKYGASPGKMAVGIKIVTYSNEKPGWGEIFLRNLFSISISLASLSVTINVFSVPEFSEVSTFMEYSQFLTIHTNANMVNYIIYPLYLIEIIMFLSDSRGRSLHDRIAKTYVVRN